MVIIVPQVQLAPDGMVGVSELVDKYYTLNKKITMSRGCFDDTKGAMLVNNLATKKPSALGLDTYYKQYYLCLVATAATIKWNALFSLPYNNSITINEIIIYISSLKLLLKSEFLPYEL
ncbi:hypothetical protein IHE45_03G047700 [Dioscorea alata]|uniref:Uncharacterized protein n=1 Tax=Dioscorea alata TaxID=55571 RepID=A0ACB7WK36_DIOAL|nr:hypothetical protein IHE45_03G047700 [Dioscorea alata]